MWYAVSGRNGFFNDDSEPSMEDDGEIVGTTGDDGLMSCSMLYDDGGYDVAVCGKYVRIRVWPNRVQEPRSRSSLSESDWPKTSCSLLSPLENQNLKK